MAKNVYRNLQKHLNNQPVGYPRTVTGAEINLLKHLFDPLHAEIAQLLSFKPEKSAVIFQRLTPELRVALPDRESLHATLMEMSSRGGIIYSHPRKTFALVPFVVGMYEFQLNRLNKEFLENTTSFGYQGFGLEFLTTHKPQSRVVPLDIKIENDQKVATYDEYRSLIRAAEGHIAVLPCICRTAADAKGQPCTHSDERDLCMALRDYADMAVREGIGRALSVEEALALAERNLEAGLVLQCSNDKQPQFICACCDDCCGLLAMIKSSPAPADHIGSGYEIGIDLSSCIACGLCVEKCPMDALSLAKKDLEPKVLTADFSRCIGCGVCTAVCRKDALVLRPKENRDIPPETMEDLHEILGENRPGFAQKAKLGLKIAGKMISDKLG